MPVTNAKSANLPIRRPSYFIIKQRFYHKALQLEQKTNFSRSEIEGLLRIFDKVVEKYKCQITKVIFKDILFNFFGLTNDLMMEKIFRAMAKGNVLTYDDWIYGMNIFLRGSFLQMANFAFTVYDQQKRGYLTKEDVQFYLKDVLVIRIAEEDADELYTDMVDMVLGLMDQDKDGIISRKDFVHSVMIEPLLIEALGECLPNSKCVLTLESLIREGKERVHISYQPKIFSEN